MSDTTEQSNASENGSDNEPNIKALRQAAEEGKAARAEAEQAKREILFLRAGVDTDSKLGGLLLKTWEGEDVEALKSEWTELTGGSKAPEVPEEAYTPEQAEQQQHREGNGSATSAGEQPPETPDPRKAAMSKFHDTSEGLPREDRQEAALAEVLGAFTSGDKRVMFSKPAWQQRLAQQGE